MMRGVLAVCASLALVLAGAGIAACTRVVQIEPGLDASLQAQPDAAIDNDADASEIGDAAVDDAPVDDASVDAAPDAP
jgi:hypothetical protein